MGSSIPLASCNRAASTQLETPLLPEWSVLSDIGIPFATCKAEPLATVGQVRMDLHLLTLPLQDRDSERGRKRPKREERTSACSWMRQSQGDASSRELSPTCRETQGSTLRVCPMEREIGAVYQQNTNEAYAHKIRAWANDNASERTSPDTHLTVGVARVDTQMRVLSCPHGSFADPMRHRPNIPLLLEAPQRFSF